jgi:S-adenosylmethionine hydrolase
LILTFLSDFGLKDEYVATCKGVIKSISPQIEVIDITHLIPHFDIRKGAFTLLCAARYFPPSVHLAVVDPGVGTERKPIAIKTKKGSYFVGPDNGLLIPAAEEEGILEVREISEKHWLKPTSPTFQARDIFSPLAAKLARGDKFEEVGEKVEKFSPSPFTLPQEREDGYEVECLDVDDFGTLRFNLKGAQLESWGIREGDLISLSISSFDLSVPFYSTFGKVERGKPLFFVDSSGFLALGVNQGRADKVFSLNSGDKLIIKRGKRG